MLSAVSRCVGDDKSVISQSFRVWLTLHCLIGETFKSRDAVKVLKKTQVLQRGPPRTIAFPNASGHLSLENFASLRFSDVDNGRYHKELGSHTFV